MNWYWCLGLFVVKIGVDKIVNPHIVMGGLCLLWLGQHSSLGQV